MKLKNNKGAAGADVAIAIVILMLFLTLIAGLFYNLSSSSNRIERKAKATNLAIEIIEALKVTAFENLYSTEEDQMTIQELNSYASKQISIPNGYTIKILRSNKND